MRENNKSAGATFSSALRKNAAEAEYYCAFCGKTVALFELTRFRQFSTGRTQPESMNRGQAVSTAWHHAKIRARVQRPSIAISASRAASNSARRAWIAGLRPSITAAQARNALIKAEPSSLGHLSAKNQAASPALLMVIFRAPPELRVTGTLKNLSSVMLILRRSKRDERAKVPPKYR